MRFSFRMDAVTFCALMGAMLALLVLLDIQSLHQAKPHRAGMTSGVQERVVTREFVLADENGSSRVRIGMNELNAPALSLYDKSGNERALLRLNQNNIPSLRLFDANGTMREGMGFAQGSLEPHLWFFDANGGTSELMPSAGGVRLNYRDQTIRLNYSLPMHDYNTGTRDGVILWDGSGVVDGIGPNAH